MAGIDLPKQKIIYKTGQSLTALHLITRGLVRVYSPDGEYLIGKGDVIGICELCSEVHFLTYETLEEVNILTYPLPGLNTLQELFEKHPDIIGLFLISAFRQICTLLNHCDVSGVACSNLYNHLREHLTAYQNLSQRYRFPTRELEGIEQITTYVGTETPDMWLNGYYMGLLHIFSENGTAAYAREPAVAIGFLRKASLDFNKTYLALEEQAHYQEQLLHFYMNPEEEDLFAALTSLYYRVAPATADTTELYEVIQNVISTAGSYVGLDSAMLSARLRSFHENLSRIGATEPTSTDAQHQEVHAQLAGSLSAILEYACADKDIAVSFRQNIAAYKMLPDKYSLDEHAALLRKQITEEFYTIYSLVLEKSLVDENLPLPVKLFLYFGYVDEELAGASNSLYLYQLTFSLKGISVSGVYTFYDWLKSIYLGEKQPSRNEFGDDYTDYLHKQKLKGNLTEKELKLLTDNPMSKVVYELRNMFPLVNKITYGRITTFCPVFTSENVLKDLPSSYVTASSIGSVLERIKAVDYSAFYRETLNTESPVAQKEIIHVECLPDIILMPNVGNRGVMWQEIESRRRTTPARMMLSIFHMEDLFTSMIRLVGDYRWEMCKRLQGARWNDISDRSLTSEYFDYIQFYKKNNDLSSEAKERIRQSLQGAKNSYKEMFIRDYLLWILLESSGSPRLNKIARQILFTYCPFSRDIREKLKTNPLYTELLQRHDIQCQQRLHHLNRLCQKLGNEGKNVPETIRQEISYYVSQIQT